MLELLGVLATAPRLFQCILNLEPYSLGVIIILLISNSSIQLPIFLLHILIQALQLNTQSSTYLIPSDYAQSTHYHSYLMQHSLTPNVLRQQWL